MTSPATSVRHLSQLEKSDGFESNFCEPAFSRAQTIGELLVVKHGSRPTASGRISQERFKLGPRNFKLIEDNRPNEHVGNDVTNCFRSAFIEVRKTAENAASNDFVRIKSNAVSKASSNLSIEEYR